MWSATSEPTLTQLCCGSTTDLGGKGTQECLKSICAAASQLRTALGKHSSRRCLSVQIKNSFSSSLANTGLTHNRTDDKSKISPSIGKNDVFVHMQTFLLLYRGFGEKSHLWAEITADLFQCSLRGDLLTSCFLKLSDFTE